MAIPLFLGLPIPIRVALAGLGATTLLIVFAVAVRTPPPDYESDDGEHSVAPSAAVVPSATERRPIVPIARDPGPTSPVAAPLPPQTAAPQAPPGPEPVSKLVSAREVRARFHDNVQNRRFTESIAAMRRLLELDPKAAEDGDVRHDLIELAMRVMLVQGREPEEVFDIITVRIGPVGGDILYELLTTRGGSRAAKQAEDLLRDPTVRARGTAAMRIAYDLRVARSCEEKIALFHRAKAEGDSRTLGQLQMLNHSCGRRGGNGDCCLHNDSRLREAMDAMNGRKSVHEAP